MIQNSILVIFSSNEVRTKIRVDVLRWYARCSFVVLVHNILFAAVAVSVVLEHMKVGLPEGFANIDPPMVTTNG